MIHTLGIAILFVTPASVIKKDGFVFSRTNQFNPANYAHLCVSVQRKKTYYIVFLNRSLSITSPFLLSQRI